MAAIEFDSTQKLELLENVNRAANIGVFQFEVETKKIYWNEVLKSIHEVSQDFIPNIDNIFDFIKTPELQDQIKQAHIKGITSGKSFELEAEILTAKGNKVQTLTLGQPIFKNDKCVYIHGSVLDITERKNRELELLQKNQQLDVSEEGNQIGYWRWNTITNTEIWSDQLYKIFEKEKVLDLTYSHYLSYVHPDDLDLVSKKINKAFIDKILPVYSHRILLENGSIKTILVSAHVITNKKNEVIEMVGTCQDISDEKAQELELSQKTKQLVLTEQKSLTGSWQWNLDKNKFKYTDNLYKILDLEIGTEINEELLYSLIHPDDLEYIKTEIQKILETNSARTYIHRIRKRDGNYKTIEVFAEPVNTAEKQTRELIGTTCDITNKLITEQNLREKNQLLDLSEQLVKIGYWRFKIATNDVFWSDNLYKIFGHPKEGNKKLHFETYFDCVHPEDQAFVKEKIQQAIKDGQFQDFIHRVLLKNGEIKTIQIVGKVNTNTAGKVTELLGSCSDISESKNKELELTQKNLQFNFAERMAMMGSWQWNPNTDESKWSDNQYKIYGLKVGEPIKFESIFSLMHPEDEEHAKKIIKKIFEDKQFSKFNYRVVLDNGEIKTLEIQATITTDEAGNITLIQGTTHDITKRVKSEQEIFEKNQLLSFAEKMAMIGSWKWDPETDAFTWSDNLYKIFGFEPHTKITRELRATRIHPDDRAYVKAQAKKIIDGKTNGEFSYRILSKDGNTKTLNALSEVIRDKKGNVISIIGTAQDVTESKNKEIELLHKNEQLNEAEQLAISGSFNYKPISEELIWSDNLYRIYGFKIGSPMNFDKLLTCIHPDDIENMKNHRIGVMNSKTFQEIICKVQHKNGTTRIVKSVGKLITNTTGEIVEIIGTVSDITEQQRAENKLLETNVKLEKSTNDLSSRNKQLAEFNHITSHNLRAPVSNLNALLNLWKSTEDQKEKDELFEKFEIVIDHLTLTLNSLIESLKVTNSEKKSQKELCFNNTLEKTKEILAAEILTSGAIIKSDFSTKTKINYNQIYLDSIFLNLISNSIKYKSPNRVPEIHIKSSINNDKITLQITDNGLGIDLKKHGHKLFGLNKVFHRHPDAKGIGLFLTKAQVESTGGSIFANSEVNVGTTFTITFN